VGTMDLRKEWLTNKKENGIKQGKKKSMLTVEREKELYFSFIFIFPLLQLPSYIRISRTCEEVLLPSYLRV
jgi:hypothetical protein